VCGRICKERRGAVTALDAALAPTGRARVTLMVTARSFLAVDTHESFAGLTSEESLSCFPYDGDEAHSAAHSPSAERKTGRLGEVRS
jgi:hypothetical protein